MFPLNVVLSFSGCNIFPFRKPWINFVVQLHTLLLLISHGYSIYWTFSTTQEDTILLSLASFVYLLMAIPLILIIYFNKKSLQRLLITIIRQLPDSEIRKLKRLVILFSFLIPLTLTFRVMDILKNNFPLELFFLQYNQLNTPVISDCPLLLFCLIATQSYEVHKISVLCSSIEQKTPYKVVLSIKSIVEKKTRLMELFSFLPVSWFLFSLLITFALVSITLLYNLSVVSDIVYLILVLVLLFIVMDTTDRCQERCNSQLDKLSTLIMKVHGNNIHEWTPVLTSIEAAQNFKWMAWDLFPFHRQTMAPFIGSFISFSAMLVQTLPSLLTKNNKN